MFICSTLNELGCHILQMDKCLRFPKACHRSYPEVLTLVFLVAVWHCSAHLWSVFMTIPSSLARWTAPIEKSRLSPTEVISSEVMLGR